jgi:hypothetical protein
LITVDWIGGIVAGLLVLSLRGWLAELYSLPDHLLLVIGLANLAYGSVSMILALSRRGERVPFLRVMAGANVAWAVVCFGLAVVWFGTASVFGMVQLVGEGLYVGVLGILEWRAAGAVASVMPTGSDGR